MNHIGNNDKEVIGLREQIKEQAAFAYNLTYDVLDADVIHQAQRIILDSLGNIFLGSKKHMDMADTLENRSFLWTNYMVDTELYEGNRFAVGHPACHILPLMLSVCRDKDISWEKFLTTFVAAYEVAARWGAAVLMPNHILGHGTIMTAGAAVAYALLQGADEKILYQTILLSSSLPNVSVWQAVYDGSALHNAYAGIGSMVAVKAYEMAVNGFFSTEKIIRQVYEKVYGASVMEDKLAEGLGRDYRICRNYYKIHTGCRFIHMFADLMQAEIVKGLKADDIEKIEILTYKKAAQISDRNVSNSMAIKFSMPASLAVQLMTGSLSPEHVDQCAGTAGAALLAGKISVSETDTYNALLPDIRGGRMIIRRKNGTKTDQEVFGADGDFDYPIQFTDRRLIEKFLNNVKDVLAKADAGFLADRALSVDKAMMSSPANMILSEFYAANL